jgi:hypothetical protein
VIKKELAGDVALAEGRTHGATQIGPLTQDLRVSGRLSGIRAFNFIRIRF